MCLFPLPNLRVDGIAYQKGVTEFDCGACPECLSKRSSQWALRCVYEAKDHPYNCMITLTYDNFNRDSRTGKILGEKPVNPNLCVSVRDIQLFIKRLRKFWSTVSGSKIKYLCCAEYGTRTHRAHYHLILFGVNFFDRYFYKKSKRGNPIYMSQTLTNLWGNGICTIDSVNVFASVARYCTKYCAKERSDDTFMLTSQGIGLNALLRDFNGKSYFIDGREYPIPRIVWQRYIVSKYSCLGLDYRYVNKQVLGDFIVNMDEYLDSCRRRRAYMYMRDHDLVYISYLEYWHKKGLQFEQRKQLAIKRIYLLDERRYHFYKVAALKCYAERKISPVPAPKSKCVSVFYHSLFDRERRLGIIYSNVTCPYPSCHNRASDTVKKRKFDLYEYSSKYSHPWQKNLQISLDCL